jgi:hypothetical protein
LPLPFGADVQSVPGTTPNPAPLQLSTLNPGSAVAIPPIQQPIASLPLPFSADFQSVPGTTTNPAPLQLSTLNPGSAVAIPPIQPPTASLPLPFAADVQSVPGTTLNPAPLQLSTLNPQAGSAAVAIPPIQQLAANPTAVNTVEQPLYNLPAPLGVDFQPTPIPETATAIAHHQPFNFPATGWLGFFPSPFTNSNNTTTTSSISIPSWDFSETKNNIGESFSFTDYLNAPVNNSESYDFRTPDMSVSPNFNMYLPQFPHSSDRENSEAIQVPTNLSSTENDNAEKENEGLDRASRSRRPTTSKGITAMWRESAYAYFCQELDSEEWKKCIDLWLEFEKNEENGLETNSVSIYPSL